ncbi:MAG TPA: DUF6623 family protein [Pyrinomonadaceae bacterium]|nr:DUF6623 family protein [Pyrinomonadaceae bacterium]
MQVTSRWVHGTIVQAEGDVEHIIRKGWGTHIGLKQAKENWFHFPLTTLSEYSGHSLQVGRVFVLYSVEPGVVINEVHVYDGVRLIAAFDKLGYGGTHDAKIDEYNQWYLDPPVTVHFGVGISVKVEIQEDARVGIPEVVFNAAGAEFSLPVGH